MAEAEGEKAQQILDKCQWLRWTRLAFGTSTRK